MSDRCCKPPLGRYVYTDGREVDLCPWCDAEHADELAVVVSERDATGIEHAAEWIVSAVWAAHGVPEPRSSVPASYRFDVLYSAQAAARAEAHAGDTRLENYALIVRRRRLITALGEYVRTVLDRRLAELLDAARAEGHAEGLTAPRGRRRRAPASSAWEPSDGT